MNGKRKSSKPLQSLGNEKAKGPSQPPPIPPQFAGNHVAASNSKGRMILPKSSNHLPAIPQSSSAIQKYTNNSKQQKTTSSNSKAMVVAPSKALVPAPFPKQPITALTRDVINIGEDCHEQYSDSPRVLTKQQLRAKRMARLMRQRKKVLASNNIKLKGPCNAVAPSAERTFMDNWNRYTNSTIATMNKMMAMSGNNVRYMIYIEPTEKIRSMFDGANPVLFYDSPEATKKFEEECDRDGINAEQPLDYTTLGKEIIDSGPRCDIALMRSLVNTFNEDGAIHTPVDLYHTTGVMSPAFKKEAFKINPEESLILPQLTRKVNKTKAIEGQPMPPRPIGNGLTLNIGTAPFMPLPPPPHIQQPAIEYNYPPPQPSYPTYTPMLQSLPPPPQHMIESEMDMLRSTIDSIDMDDTAEMDDDGTSSDLLDRLFSENSNDGFGFSATPMFDMSSLPSSTTATTIKTVTNTPQGTVVSNASYEGGYVQNSGSNSINIPLPQNLPNMISGNSISIPSNGNGVEYSWEVVQSTSSGNENNGFWGCVTPMPKMPILDYETATSKDKTLLDALGTISSIKDDEEELEEATAAATTFPPMPEPADAKEGRVGIMLKWRYLKDTGQSNIVPNSKTIPIMSSSSSSSSSTSTPTVIEVV